jgi:ABC-type lipoprotein export system ATPase subunit
MIANTNTQPAHRIRSVSIVFGFLDVASFDFADGLNCVIGARGAGKTTVVELIRYALDTFPDGQAERRRIESLVERNLAGGEVRVAIETKDSLTYLVSRTAGEEAIVLSADGKPTNITLSASGLFRADIYSQNEVEGIADRTTSQLVLIDNFEAARIAEIESRLAEVRTELTNNANKIVPLQSRIVALGEELSTLPGIEERLKKFNSAGGNDAKTINQAHSLKSLRDRERRVVLGSVHILQEAAKHFASLQGHIGKRGQSLADDEVNRGPNAAIVQTAVKQFDTCAAAVDRQLRAIESCLTATVGQIAGTEADLNTVHKQQELAFRSLIEKHEQARTQAAERAQLERRRNELVAKQRERGQLQEELAKLQADRKSLLEKHIQIQDERFTVRQSVVDRINADLSPTIRVQVSQYGNPELYVRLLEEALKHARIKHLIVAQKLARAFWPTDLVAIVRGKDAAALVDRGELNSEQAGKVIAALSNSERLYELETVELCDLPCIELKDGTGYKDSLTLSTGQKCTTILPILLLDSDNPLLVDQPEDNLDNRFIFEAVVDSIRKMKTRRQMIFVTHNPNIPVLGDAERVFVLDSDGDSARKANEGTVDECKTDIVTLLEGGEDAFKARKCRYAY